MDAREEVKSIFDRNLGPGVFERDEHYYEEMGGLINLPRCYCQYRRVTDLDGHHDVWFINAFAGDLRILISKEPDPPCEWVAFERLGHPAKRGLRIIRKRLVTRLR